MTPRWLQVAWVGTVVVAVALAVVGMVEGWSQPRLLGGPAADLLDVLGLHIHLTIAIGLISPLALYTAVAAFVFVRRPHDRMALLFGITIVTFGAVATRGLGVAFVTRPTLRPGVVLVSAVAVGALGLLLATFPEGRVRARWALLAPLLLVTGLVVHPSFVEAILGLPEMPAAASRFQAATTLLTAGFLVGLAAQAVGYRRASPLLRQQIKWVIAPLALFVAGAATILVGSATGVFTARVLAVNLLAMVPVGLLLPVAWARAILRYRLYEIDRIISRTVAYGLVVAVLAGVYSVGVIGLGTLLSAVVGVEGSDLAVAASVLAAVALFRPLRTRVQSVVDRRFNRTGYEARRAVDAFPDRVHSEVELEAIRRELATTASVAVAPTGVSVWLADDARAALAHGRRRP